MDTSGRIAETVPRPTARARDSFMNPSSLAAPRSLLALLRDVEAGRTTPARAVAAARERAGALNGTLHAFARLADPAAPPPAGGPLAGVSLGVKDIFDTADMATEHGSPIYRGFRPRADAPLVASARLAGASVLGKTATTEFAFLQPSETRNPHDPARTPGGSSSGSAAAVAAGLVEGAFGTQTAGSVIRPAAFCGVAGFKPSFRLLPMAGAKPFAPTLDTAGLFAAGVADVAHLAAVLSRRADLAAGEAPSRLRVGLYRSRIDDLADPAMRDAWERAARLWERAGAMLIDIAETDALHEARRAQPTLQLFEGALSLLHERTHHSALLSPLLREALDEGAAIEPAAYDEARRRARRGRREATMLFERCDVLLAPSAPGAAPRTLASTGDPAFNRLWTLTGNPCVNVPGALDTEGMPLGLTVVARFGRDALALRAAERLESLLRVDA